MAKVFCPNAPTCPECGNKMVWDEDEQCWYCLNCSYWEEEEEEPECLGLINIAYSEICEVCEFREVCEEIAKENDDNVV